jgi:predicted ATP-grasp superfamily ATP-dependent carboligase
MIGAEPHRTPAIVCDAEKISQTAIIQELGSRGIPIVAISTSARAMGFASKYVQQRIICPVLSYDPDFVRFLLDRAPRGVVLCSNDANAENISQFRDALRSGGFSLLLSDRALLDRVVSKDRLYYTGLECGVAVPKGAIVETAAELEARVAAFGLPLILKSTNLAGGVYRFVPSLESAADVFREMTQVIRGGDLRHRNAKLMAQQWIPPQSSTLWNFNACAKGGEILSFSMGRRIRTDTRPDGSLGSVLLFGRTEYNPELLDENARLLAHLKYDGILETEWAMCGDGPTSWFLYDFNPRPSGNIRWACKSGVSLAYQCYRAALGLPPEPQRMTSGIVYAKVLYHQCDWLEALRGRHIGVRGKLAAVWDDLAALMRSERHAVDVFDLRDLGPTLQACRDLGPVVARAAAAFLRRCSRRPTLLLADLQGPSH